MKHVNTARTRSKSALHADVHAPRRDARAQLNHWLQRENVRFLSARERQLMRLAFHIGARDQSGVIAQTQACHQLGLTATELLEVALLAVSEIDCPEALSWINDGLD